MTEDLEVTAHGSLRGSFNVMSYKHKHIASVLYFLARFTHLEVAQEISVVLMFGNPEDKYSKMKSNIIKETAFTHIKPFSQHLRLLHILFHYCN